MQEWDLFVTIGNLVTDSLNSLIQQTSRVIFPVQRRKYIGKLAGALKLLKREWLPRSNTLPTLATRA